MALIRFGLVIALLLLSGLAACSPKAAWDAVRLVQAAASPQAKPPQPSVLRWLADGKSYSADRFAPHGRPRAGLVLIPGVARAGNADRRLLAFVRILTDAGFVVMVPDLENLRQLRIDSGDIGAIAATFDELAAEPSSAGLKLGIAAVSYSVGPAILAALRPGIVARVDFLVGVGGYYSSEDVIRFFTTGAFRLPGEVQWRHLEPNEYGKWLFVNANTVHIHDAGDRTTLQAMAGRKLDNLDADISDLVATLGPEGGAIYELAANKDPGRVPALIRALPSEIRQAAAALSPARHDLGRLKAHLILIHGRDDVIVPYSESVALAAAAPHADLYLVDRLHHVKLQPQSLADALTLARAAYRLLEERR